MLVSLAHLENQSASPTKIFLKTLHLWVVFLLIKLGLASLLPYSPDESYYWVWSQKLALSYFDHPAMIAWVLKLNDLLSLPSFMDRWVLVLIGQACIAVWLLIYDHLKLDPNKKIWFLLLMQMHPMTGWGNLLATPDTPLHLFVALSFLNYLKALDSGQWLHYALFGISLGLGFCSKYQIVLLLPPLLISTFWLYRSQWRWSGIAVTLITGLISCSPVLIWNFTHDMISFKFQLDHGLGSEVWDPIWTFKYVLGQVALVSPFLLTLLFKLWKNPENRESRKDLTTLLVVASFILLFFLYSSFKGAVEANWPSLAYPFAFLLAAYFWNSKKLILHSAFWGGLLVALTVVLLALGQRKWSEKAFEPFIIKNIAQEIKDFSPLYGGSYQLASALWHEYQTPIYKVAGMSRFDMYDLWQNGLPKEKKFYVLKYNNTDWPTQKKIKFRVKLLRSFPLELELYEVTRD